MCVDGDWYPVEWAARPRSPREFFADHPVFTVGQYAEHIRGPAGIELRSSERRVIYRELDAWVEMRAIERIRPGLFIVTPPRFIVWQPDPDPYVIAGAAAEGMPLCLHTAVALLGRREQRCAWPFTAYADRRRGGFRFRDWRFDYSVVPRSVRDAGAADFGCVTVQRATATVLVTGPERTLVDCLVRPERFDGPHGVCRWLKSMWAGVSWHEAKARGTAGIRGGAPPWDAALVSDRPLLDPEVVRAYLELIDSRLAAATVGYYLERHQARLEVCDDLLRWLEERRPRAPVYWDRTRASGGSFVRRWNLIVPS